MLKRSFLGLAVLLVAACEPPAPLVPAAIVMVDAAPTTATVGSALAAAPTFEVQTASGKAIKGVTVAVTTGSNSGSVTSTPTKTLAGPTPVGSWTLGGFAGVQSLRINVEGLPQFVVSLQATAAAAATITLVEGGGQFASEGTAVAMPIRVLVQDDFGNAKSGETVTWTVTAGGGLVASPTSITNGSGVAEAPAWTVGAAGSGAQTLTASVGGVTRLVSAVVQAPPATITLETAAPVSGLLGSPITPAPTFAVRDAGGNVLPAVPVTLTVTAGGGAITGTPAATVAGGGATSIGTWTLGSGIGVQQVTVEVTGIPSLVISTTGVTQYSLEVVYSAGTPDPAIEAAFNSAIARIRTVIVGPQTPVFSASQIDLSGGACAAGTILAAHDTIAGLRIYASLVPIDGAGGVLGSAGPRLTRTSNSLAAVGCMRFDTADLANMVANGSLQSVILHEMLHVVGVGTLWNSVGMMTGSAPATVPQFLGPLARLACINDHGGGAFCSAFVPIEDCKTLAGVTRAGCGAGTINSHWHELIFGNELMTGFASAGLNPFSRMTIQSLRDMGYVTNLFASDNYTLPPAFSALMAGLQAPKIALPQPEFPIGSLSQNGQFIPKAQYD